MIIGTAGNLDPGTRLELAKRVEEWKAEAALNAENEAAAKRATGRRPNGGS
jgi:hypothetical protein